MAEKENLLVNLNDITEKEASWLVPQRMPKGQIIILAGDGGSGKTNAWCALAAAISSGKQVFFDETPKEFFQAEPQRVLFFSSEDSLEYTLKARLRKAGANFNNIFSVDLKNERFSEIKFNSELLKSLIEDVKPTLVVFDPLQAFVPVDMQMGQRNAMRACLTFKRNPFCSAINCTFRTQNSDLLFIASLQKLASSSSVSCTSLWLIIFILLSKSKSK